LSSGKIEFQNPSRRPPAIPGKIIFVKVNVSKDQYVNLEKAAAAAFAAE
jgi:hypothetical protein